MDKTKLVLWTAAAGVAIWIGVGLTWPQLVATVPDCAQVDLVGSAYDSDAGAYRQLAIRGFRCADAGGDLVMPQLPPNLLAADLIAVVDAGTYAPDDGGLVVVPFSCACSSGASCALPDGGAAPTGMTLNPGTWSGTGCVPKACAEISGTSSWPAGCPQ